MTIYPVIMCGGAGTRLWPVSTQNQPKQFHRLVTSRSVFQDTVLRFTGADAASRFARPVIISNARYEDLIRQQLSEIGVEPEAIILEPVARNTAAVAAVAAKYIESIAPEALGLLLPSDHFIGQAEVFLKAIGEAATVAQQGMITTFGIKATKPETGFGYIQSGEVLDGQVSKVSRFREKPDLETAMTYLADPAFSWNAGIFLFPVKGMLQEFSSHAADILEASSQALASGERRGPVITLDEAAFAEVRSISVDYAIMEHTAHAAVYAPLDCQWSDIGTWGMIGELKQPDSGSNLIEIDARNCAVHAGNGQLIALVGVSDLCVVVEGDRVLVTSKDRTQDVGKIVKVLKDQGKTDFL